jgi:L-ascorbate 6-phosphate lactonase
MSTIHSHWGDWLPQEVAAADPACLTVWYLGCNGFLIKGTDGTVLMIDPYLGGGDPPRTVRMIPIPFSPESVASCDAILATHEHTDHTHGPSQAPILERTGATFYAPDASIEVAVDDERWSETHAVAPEQLVTVEEGERFSVGAIDVTVEPAHDPDARHPVSFVVSDGQAVFFHGGDARPSEAFSDIGSRYDIDLGALAFGSTGYLDTGDAEGPRYTEWYAGPNDIASAASQLELSRLLPTHWDMWRGLTADPRSIHDHCRSAAHPQLVDVAQIGDRIPVLR